MEKKYLDYDGLKTLVDRIKELGPGGGGGLPLVTEMPSNPSAGDIVCWGGAETVSYRRGALYEWVPPTEEDKFYYCYVESPQEPDPRYLYLDVRNPQVGASVYCVYDKTQDPPAVLDGPATDISELGLIDAPDFDHVTSIDTSVEPITISFGPSGSTLTAVRDSDNDISGPYVHPGYWKEVIVHNSIEVVHGMDSVVPEQEKTVLFIGPSEDTFESCHVYCYLENQWEDVTEETFQPLYDELATKNNQFQYEELPSHVIANAVIQDISSGDFYKGISVDGINVEFNSLSSFVNWINTVGESVSVWWDGMSESGHAVLLEMNGIQYEFLAIPPGIGSGIYYFPTESLVDPVDLNTLAVTNLISDQDVVNLGSMDYSIGNIDSLNVLEALLQFSENNIQVGLAGGTLSTPAKYLMLYGTESGEPFMGQFFRYNEWAVTHSCFIKTDEPFASIDGSDPRVNYYEDISLYDVHGSEWKLLSPEPIPTNDVEALFHGEGWTPSNNSDSEEP